MPREVRGDIAPFTLVGTVHVLERVSGSRLCCRCRRLPWPRQPACSVVATDGEKAGAGITNNVRSLSLSVCLSHSRLVVLELLDLELELLGIDRVGMQLVHVDSKFRLLHVQ